ncbi:MAG: hypothetical protein LBI92_11950 [Azoarcus sp.]|jgi:hypothetical protein|nr:hypothetical protein [Azoarcus sp.]
MRRLIIAALCLSLGGQLVFAELTFAEPLNWDEAKWTCPSSITVRALTFKLHSVAVSNGPPENLEELIPERVQDAYRWRMENRNTYLSCIYDNFKIRLAAHAKGASFCAYQENPVRAACWTASGPR